MKKLTVVFGMVLLLLGVVGYAGATVLDFENGAVDNTPISSYGGFTWNNIYTYSYVGYNFGWDNNLSSVSGDLFAFNAFGTSASLSDGADFDFNGAFLSGWTYGDSYYPSTANSVTITGYNNGTLVGTYVANFILGLRTMEYFDVGMNGVDQLIFTPNGSFTDKEMKIIDGGWFVMDDFTYNATAVPEPATLLLLGLGLVGVAGLKRKLHK
jgi:hypothetical protein